MRTVIPIAVAALAATAHAEEFSIHAVERVVSKQERAIQSCARFLDRRGEMVAVTVLISIEADGQVSEAFSPTDTRAAQCLEKLARTLRFPAPGDATQIAYPFLLAPRR